MPIKLSSNEIEAANRGEATSLLIRSGYRVYRAEADVNGEDLIIKDLSGRLLPVQLKGRPMVEFARYGGRGLWMLFPDPNGEIPGRSWFLIEHDALFNWMKSRHGAAPKWSDHWSYPVLTKPVRDFLEHHRLAPAKPDAVP